MRCWQGEQALHVSNTDEGRDRSRLAATFFLNMGWDNAQGGAEHRLCYASGGSRQACRAGRVEAARCVDVAPGAGTLLLWLPHRTARAVLPAKRTCWSLTVLFKG